jgi:hypothetical protein
MNRTRTVAPLAAIILCGVPLTLLVAQGTASAQPGLDDCAASLAQDQGLSARQARAVCKGTPNSVQPDLGYCAALLAQDQGLSTRRARSVCAQSPAHH